MGHLAKQRDASFFRVFFNLYRYGVLTDYSPRRNAPVDRFFCSLIFEIIHRLVGNTVQYGVLTIDLHQYDLIKPRIFRPVPL